jgi:urease accessory protein
MIIEEKTNALLGAASPVADLVLPFEQRQKSRLLATLSTGEEAALFMPRGTILRGGDWLKAQDGRVVRVVAAPERVMQVVCKDAHTLTRVAYHLGNRHVPLQVGDGWLRLESDHVLKEMLVGLGAEVQEADAAFEPESGAYGGHGGHTHGSSNAKIHDHHHEHQHDH